MDAVQEKRAMATPGPWRWTKQFTGMWTLMGGRSLLVMDFVRQGMNHAQPRFSDRNGTDKGGIMHKAEELDLTAHPDACLIAAAPLLKQANHTLAMLGLQSERYATDADFRDAVDFALEANALAEGRSA